MIVSGEQWRDSTIHIQTSVSHAGVPTPCDPMDCSLPGSFVHGILQARILEWVAISFSRGSSRPRYQTRVSCIAGRFFTIWAARKAHLCIHVFILPKTPLLSRLPHNIEQSSMCYTVGLCWFVPLYLNMYSDGLYWHTSWEKGDLPLACCLFRPCLSIRRNPLSDLGHCYYVTQVDMKDRVVKGVEHGLPWRSRG